MAVRGIHNSESFGERPRQFAVRLSESRLLQWAFLTVVFVVLLVMMLGGTRMIFDF